MTDEDVESCEKGGEGREDNVDEDVEDGAEHGSEDDEL